MSETTTTPPDHTACDNEPVHAPGAIQPFGVLLALDKVTLKVVQASANSRELFGSHSHGAVPLGATAAELLGPLAEPALRYGLAKDGLIEHRPIAVSVVGADSGRWHGVAHSLGGMVFVELEPADEAASSAIELLAAVRASVGQLFAAAAIEEFSASVASRVRSLTGYDRVMVYRFDADWNGKVVAEDRLENLEPFLGLHYPASDIPAPARALFLVNRIRVIPDAAAEPIPIIAGSDVPTGAPLDMSRCLLRSAAPVHREYLHNMGVRASLTASLIIGSRLWGLIACHHSTPKRPGPAEREACDLLAQIASAHLAFQAEAEDRAHLASLGGALSRTAAKIGDTTPPIAALAKNEADLLALVGASGGVIWRSGRGVSIGQTPPEQALLGLMQWIKGTASRLIAIDRLSQLYVPAQQFADVASGLLALEVSREADEYVLWFRPEVVQSVHWGGDPRGKIGPDGRLSPRRSFALWKETVRERALPWRPAEVENAKRVKEFLLAAASLALLRLEALLPICAWCKKVRDEPDYWHKVEDFIVKRVDVRFTHGICPDCLQKQKAEISAIRNKNAAS